MQFVLIVTVLKKREKAKEEKENHIKSYHLEIVAASLLLYPFLYY